MGGVNTVPNAAEKAVNAGCDIVLMPLNIEKTFNELYQKMKQDPNFRKKVEVAAKRIVRMKICLSLIK